MAYGDTWTPTKNLTNNAGNSENPAIAVDGLNVYVVWSDFITYGNTEIHFKKSVDGGATWTKNRRLTWNAGSSATPAIAVDGQNIYVVWRDDTSGNNEIYFKKSVDRGNTWTKKQRLTWNAGWSEYPDIAVDGPNIYVVWMDYPSDNWEICFKKSADGGATWTKNRRLSWNASNSWYPDIAVDGPNIYLVWHDYPSENGEIYFKKSVDGGATWTKNKRLTWNAGNSATPAIAVDGPNIYVVWRDDTSENREIFFKKSVDGGTTWTKDKRITWTAGDSWDPAIAVDGPNIYVVWRDDTSENLEIYFKHSVDEGATWTTAQYLSKNAGWSWYPAIAVSGPNIYVVWYDNTPGNWEIYFKKGVLF